MLTRLFTDDQPVKTIEGDLLQRRRFIESLASALLLPPRSHCRVVSLEGMWGEGKTSAIEMALDLIGKRDADLKPFVARVNPWQMGTKDALVGALLKELSHIVRSEKRRQKVASFGKLAKELEAYVGALALLKAEPHGAVISAIVRAWMWALSWLTRRASDLQSQKNRVSAAIAKTGRPIIVVVDDLDRLLPEEVVEVVRFVRAVGDFERTTYLLAFDHARIIESLEQAGVPSASRFLEKIVQLRIHLPPASAASIKAILDQRLEDSAVYTSRRQFDESESRRVELYSFYIAPLLADVRTLLRVLARVEVTPIDVVREVEYWDVFAMNVILAVAPDVFEFIRAHGASFSKPTSGLPHTSGKESPVDELRDGLHIALSKSAPRTGKYVEGLVHSLFPVLGSRSARSQSWMDRNGRLAAERPLLTYLLSEVVEGQLPLDTVRAIVAEEQFREERISAASQQEEHFMSLAGALRDEIVVSGLVPKNPGALAISILERALRLPEPEQSLGFRIQDRAMGLLPLIVGLIVRDPKPDKAITNLLAADSEGVFSSLLMEEVMSSNNEDLVVLRESLTKRAMDQAMQLWTQKVHSVAADHHSANYDKLGTMLFALKRTDRDAFEAVVKKIITTSQHRQLLIRSLANSVYSSSHGRVAVWKSDLLSPGLTAQLKEEALSVLRSGTDDKALLAGSRALVDGKEIVVETGEERRK